MDSYLFMNHKGESSIHPNIGKKFLFTFPMWKIWK